MSLTRVWTVAIRVLTQLRHDVRTIVIMLVVPSLAMILFGFSFSGDIRGIRLGVIDEDETDLTGEIISALEGDPSFQVAELAPGEDPEKLLLSGYQAVVRFPEKFTSLYYAHFAMGVATAAHGTLHLWLDESDPQIAAAVRAGIADALMDIGEGGPVEVKEHPLYGVEIRFIDSFAPAIMGYVITFVCSLLTLLSVVREKVDGTFERLWTSPLRRAEFILGYVVAFGLVALVQSGLILGLGKLVFDIVINGSVAWALLCIVLFAIGNVGLGTLLSALAHTESQAILLFPLVVLPSVLLSGMLWPLQAIPSVLRPLAYLVPLTYGNRLLRAVMVKGLPPWGEPIGLAGVLVFLLLTVTLASFALRATVKE